jgi:hypothetical protein
MLTFQEAEADYSQRNDKLLVDEAALAKRQGRLDEDKKALSATNRALF